MTTGRINQVATRTRTEPHTPAPRPHAAPDPALAEPSTAAPATQTSTTRHAATRVALSRHTFVTKSQAAVPSALAHGTTPTLAARAQSPLGDRHPALSRVPQAPPTTLSSRAGTRIHTPIAAHLAPSPRGRTPRQVLTPFHPIRSRPPADTRTGSRPRTPADALASAAWVHHSATHRHHTPGDPHPASPQSQAAAPPLSGNGAPHDRDRPLGANSLRLARLHPHGPRCTSCNRATLPSPAHPSSPAVAESARSAARHASPPRSPTLPDRSHTHTDRLQPTGVAHSPPLAPSTRDAPSLATHWLLAPSRPPAGAPLNASPVQPRDHACAPPSEHRHRSHTPEAAPPRTPDRDP